MAKVQFAGIVQGVRGTLGGTVFTSGRSGPYVRAWSRGSNPKTPGQMAQRSFLSLCGSLWRALSDGEREDWDDFAADPAQEQTDVFGEPYYLSGFQWFCKVNGNLNTVLRDTTDTPPTGGYPAAPTGLVLTVPATGSGNATLAYGAGVFDDLDIVVFCSAANAGAQTAESEARRLLLYRYQDPVPASPLTLTNPATVLGTLQAGRRVWAYVYAQSNEGLRSAATVVSDEVS